MRARPRACAAQPSRARAPCARPSAARGCDEWGVRPEPAALGQTAPGPSARACVRAPRRRSARRLGRARFVSCPLLAGAAHGGTAGARGCDRCWAAGISTSAGPGTKRRAAREGRRAADSVTRSLSTAIFDTRTRCWKRRIRWQFAPSSPLRPSSLSTSRSVLWCCCALAVGCVRGSGIDQRAGARCPHNWRASQAECGVVAS